MNPEIEAAKALQAIILACSLPMIVAVYWFVRCLKKEKKEYPKAFKPMRVSKEVEQLLKLDEFEDAISN